VRIWALSDLHLASTRGKSMDMFGDRWERHEDRMAEAWDGLVAEDDVVLSPGDVSWAMKPEEAEGDLAWIAARPGTTVLVKGNHDFWWPKTRSRLAALLPEGVLGIKKNGLVIERSGKRLGLFGCRGGDFKAWPGDGRTEDDVEAWLAREERELQASFAHLQTLGPVDQVICLFHYPPIPPGGTSSRFTPLIAQSGATHCVYGHLHGDVGPSKVEGTFDGVTYLCASCDQVGFLPELVAEL
jgi:predicted phosphohydrolase